MPTHLRFKSVGRTIHVPQPVEVESGKAKTEMRYDRIRIDAKDFPYLVAKEDGDECTVAMKVVKSGSGLPEPYETDRGPWLEIEIHEMAQMESKKEEEGDDVLKEMGYKKGK